MIRLTKTRMTAIALAAFASTAIASPAAASGGGDGVTREGPCSGSSDWELQAKPRDGGLEIEFEVDSNINGQQWQVRITDNGVRLFQGTRATVAPSGSFEVNIKAPSRSGPDKIVGRATNSLTGETCIGRVTHP